MVEQQRPSSEVNPASIQLDTLGEPIKPASEQTQIIPPDKERREALLQHRDLLGAQAEKSTESYEKALLTLSSTVLGASLLVLEKLAHDPPVEIELLFWSWGGLGLSIGLLLLSFLLSVLVMHTNKDKIDEELKGLVNGKRYKQLNQRLNSLRKTVDWLNWTTFLAFIIGVIFLLWFVIVNVTAESQVSDPKQPPQPVVREDVRKGVTSFDVPPPAPQPVQPAPADLPTQPISPTEK